MPEKVSQLWWGIPGAFLSMIICFIAPVFIMKSKKSRYPFAEEEMYGYKKEKVLEIWKDSKLSILQKLGIQ